MNEGSLFAVIALPQPWPVQSAIMLFSMPQETLTLKLYAKPEGCLSFVVEEVGVVLTNYSSQLLNVDEVGIAQFTILWHNNEVTLRINGQEILEWSRARNEVCHIMVTPLTVSNIPSFDHPEATNACKNQMAWRKSLYSNPKTSAKQNRRMKTESEQIEELKNALDALTEVVLLVTQGKNYMIGHVATALRSLVYWKGQNYSPLLIRLAGRFSLPLPIFAVLDSEEIPAIVSEANLHFSSQNASIVKEFPAHILVDLQDWVAPH